MAQQADLERVTKVLLESEVYPPTVRQMLVEGLPHAVGSTGARHEYQAEFMGHVQTALAAAQERLKAMCTDALAKAEEVLSAEVDAEAAVAAAKADVEAKDGAAAAAAQAAAQAQQDCWTFAGEYEQVQNMAKALLDKRSKIREDKAAASAVFDGSLRMLLDGGWADDEMKIDAVAAVQGHIDAVADPVLRAAAPVALQLKPEERRDFDKVTLESLVEVLQAHSAALDAEIASGEAEEKMVRAEILGAWALLEVAQDDEKAKLGALKLAEMELIGAKAAHQRACLIEAQAKEISEAQSSMERLFAKNEDVEMQAMNDKSAMEAKQVDSAMDVELSATGGNPLGVATPMAA